MSAEFQESSEEVMRQCNVEDCVTNSREMPLAA